MIGGRRSWAAVHPGQASRIAERLDIIALTIVSKDELERSIGRCASRFDAVRDLSNHFPATADDPLVGNAYRL